MPAPYDYSSGSGYARARPDWADFPDTTTPILQTHLDRIDQALYDKKAEILNVGDFGVLPANSGAANDAAFANVLSTTPGGVIQFNAGNYSFASNQTLPRVTQKALLVRGMGKGATKLTFTGVGHLFTIGGTSNGDAAYGQWVEDMTIQNTYAGSAILGAVKFRAATWCGMYRVRVNGSNLGSQIHVHFDPGAGGYFCFFNAVRECGFYGIDQPSDTAIKLHAVDADGANANWIVDNSFLTYNRAVHIASGDENHIRGNHFGSFVNMGIRVDTATGNAIGNRLIENDFDGPTGAIDLAAGAVETIVDLNYGSGTYTNAGSNTIVGQNQPQPWTGAGSYIDYQSVASAATIAIPAGAQTVGITGTTNITSITAQRIGTRVTLVFAGILTFTDGSNLKLAGNFVTSADDTITLVCDGTNWIETGRSVN